MVDDLQQALDEYNKRANGGIAGDRSDQVNLRRILLDEIIFHKDILEYISKTFIIMSKRPRRKPNLLLPNFIDWLIPSASCWAYLSFANFYSVPLD